MKQLEDILNDFTLETVEHDFNGNMKLVEKFGHLISENSTPVQIQLEGIDYQLKYRGILSEVFYLSIRRRFKIEIRIQEEFGGESMFHRELVLRGKYQLKNIGGGRVEVLPGSPYSKFGNSIRTYYQPDSLPPLDEEFVAFSLSEFLKS